MAGERRRPVSKLDKFLMSFGIGRLTLTLFHLLDDATRSETDDELRETIIDDAAEMAEQMERDKNAINGRKGNREKKG